MHQQAVEYVVVGQRIVRQHHPQRAGGESHDGVGLVVRHGPGHGRGADAGGGQRQAGENEEVGLFKPAEAPIGGQLFPVLPEIAQYFGQGLHPIGCPGLRAFAQSDKDCGGGQKEQADDLHGKSQAGEARRGQRLQVVVPGEVVGQGPGGLEGQRKEDQRQDSAGQEREYN